MAASVEAVGVARLVILLLDTSTVPVPFGTRFILVFVPPAVNVRAPVPVMDPVAVPVPPDVTGKAVDNVTVPVTFNVDLKVTAPVTPSPPDTSRFPPVPTLVVK